METRIQILAVIVIALCTFLMATGAHAQDIRIDRPTVVQAAPSSLKCTTLVTIEQAWEGAPIVRKVLRICTRGSR